MGKKSSNVVTMMDARDLIPSPENSILYRERTAGDSDYARLVESIRREGVKSPILSSQDLHIISGHQRTKGAIETEQYIVPVMFDRKRRSDYSSDEWLAILREHNTGRVKSYDEMVREKLVDIDPDEAVRQIVDDQVERTRARVPMIEVGEKEMKRFGISEVKRGMVDAVVKVLHELREYLPVSLRAIHYRLLVLEFFRNSKKKTPYKNDLASYHDLSDLVTRLRLSGEIPWDSLCDETRPVTTWRCWRNSGDFVAAQLAGLFKGYARDLLQSQQQHFEIVVEKLTVNNFVRKVASRYRMPVVVMRGNSGIDARHQLVERFKKSGKKKLFLLCLGDCDPDGDSIVDSTLRSLRDDFQVQDVAGTRVAMTHRQADALKLPKMLEAKEKSPNYATFVEQHGRTDCYELEAVKAEVTQEWLDTAIRGVIDIDAYNHEVEQQTAEAPAILARLKTVLEIMRNA